MSLPLDGRRRAVWGPHHQGRPADERILPGGTGYISDGGMAGPVHSVIGIAPEGAVQKQRLHVPVRFAVPEEGPMMLNAVLFTLDDGTGLCTAVQRIDRRSYGS